MFQYVFSIVLVVGSNMLYHICQKSTPAKVNPFVALLATYVVAAVVCAVVLLFYKTEENVIQSVKSLNWSSLALGVAIVGLELGFLLAYRAGWDISIGSLVANICLTALLVPVGIYFYKEGFNGSKVIGIILCLAGLVFINKH